MQSLDGEQFPPHRANMFLVSRVDLIAPFPRSAVQILPRGEGAPRQEVSLDEAEGPFYPSDRLASPIACATNSKPNRSPKAAISGTGTISRPLPRSTTTCVLSIMTRVGVPP